MADTIYNRTAYQAQMDVVFASNTNGEIGWEDHNTAHRDMAESVAFLTSTNIYSEDNVLGEEDAVTVFGSTGIPGYTDTDEEKPRQHIFSDDQYHVRIENTDNSDADTQAWVYGQKDDGEFSFNRLQDDAGTHIMHETWTADQNGVMTINKFAYGDGSELTITSGEITVTSSYHLIDTESDAATDDLHTINGGTRDGQILKLRSTVNSRDITIQDSVGNIALNDGDFTLNNRRDRLVLEWDDTQSLWLEHYRSNI